MRSRHYQKGSLQEVKRGRHRFWMFFWYEEGRRRSRILGRCSEMTRLQANAKRHEILAPLNQPISGGQRATITFGEFVDGTYIPFCREHKWKASTTMTTKDRIAHHLVSEFGPRVMNSLKREELQEFLERKAEAGLSFSAVDHLRWDLRAIFNLAVEDGYVQRNAAGSLCTPKGAAHAEKRTTEKSDVLKAIGLLELRDRLIFKLATLCGARPGEILALQWKHVHENYAEICQRVYHGALDSPKTRRSIRKIAFPPGVAADFNAWKEICPDIRPEVWVFPSEKATPLSLGNIWRRNIRPALARAGLDWANFQVMRRTHSTLDHKVGADPKVVADQMGHGVGVNLDEYTVAQLDQLADAVTKLETALVN